MLERRDISDIDSTGYVRFTAYTSPEYLSSPVELMIVRPDYVKSTESILTDDTGSHHTWKPCEHYKCSHVPDSGSNDTLVYVDHSNAGEFSRHATVQDVSFFCPDQFGNNGQPTIGLPDFYSERVDGGFVPPPADLELLLQHAFKSMMPVIKAELSVVNSLIELKDFLSLRSSIESVKNVAASLLTKARRTPLADVFRTKADVYLQYKFNIAPLLSDISGIYRAVANHERRINDFISRSGRVRVSHWSRSLTESGDIDSPTYEKVFANSVHPYPQGPGHGSYDLLSYSSMNRSTKTEPASFHVQVQYNYNYTEYQVEHARLLSLLDALGVNLNPAIIWNAIPWSFVVDWLFGIGQYLSTFKVDNMKPKINILRCLWSIRRKRRIMVTGAMHSETRVFFPSLPASPASLVLPVVEESAYRRTPFTPGSSLIESSGLSLTETSLGAALIISRRRRPKRLRR